MELRNLRAFVEVVRQGGFSQAAKTLYLTQPTLSKAVKQLESELGLPLLDRLAQRNELTPAGHVVYRRALAMLAERDDLIAEIDELRGLRRGTLRFGLPPLSSTLFGPLFATYRHRYPGIDIHLVEHGSQRLEELLLAGEVDLAASLLPVSEDFEWQEIHTEPLMVLLPRDHPLARRKRVDLPALASTPFILFDPGFALNRLLNEACERHGIQPTVAARTGQIDFIVELVAAGLGIAFLPHMTAGLHPHPAVVQARFDEPHTEWRIALVWRRGAYLSHAARAWLEVARERYASER